jgi:hypothetical protein
MDVLNLNLGSSESGCIGTLPAVLARCTGSASASAAAVTVGDSESVTQLEVLPGLGADSESDSELGSV